MGPILLCDKSTIQSLGRASLDLLHHYFTINIPPILVIEILGDLAKKPDDTSLVKSLAKRLTSADAVPNLEFRELMAADLVGNRVRMGYRPAVLIEKVIEAENGQVGFELADDPCEKALQRWRNGDFSTDETLFSDYWRSRKESLNWRESLEKLKDCHSASMRPRKSLSDVLEFVDDMMAAHSDTLKRWFCEEFRINLSAAASTSRVIDGTYAAFCIRISLFALWSMKFELVPSKADNQLDLEYLFYLPFAQAFAARDKFQKAVAPYFLSPNQRFVNHDDLANDFSRISAWLSTLADEEKVNELQKSGPPEYSDSICHRLWNDLMRPNYRNREKRALTPENEKRLVDHIRMLRSGKQTKGLAQPVSQDRADFVFRKRSISVNDPCPCRSGKPYKDCHGRTD